MIDAIREGWSWKGIEPEAVVRTNAFGHVLFRDPIGRVWRIIPEDLNCTLAAESEAALSKLFMNPEFCRDWEMQALVDLAASKFGSQTDERCYCLKTPAVLGGSYQLENLGTISRRELISASGSIAQQVEGLPDGERITLRVRHDV